MSDHDSRRRNHYGGSRPSDSRRGERYSDADNVPYRQFSLENPDINYAQFSRELVCDFVDRYGKAWIAQDPQLIASLFTYDGQYKEKPGRCMRDHAGIQNYWRKQIQQNEKDIQFEHVAADMVQYLRAMWSVVELSFSSKF